MRLRKTKRASTSHGLRRASSSSGAFPHVDRLGFCAAVGAGGPTGGGAAIYEGGRFEFYDTQQTAVALSCYAVGLAGYAAIKVLTPALYALGDSKTPMWLA